MLGRRNGRNEGTGERGYDGTTKGLTVPSFSAFSAFLRRMTGMPDYAGYCEHLRRSHPEASLPSERQFYEDFVRSRYGDGPTRCC